MRRVMTLSLSSALLFQLTLSAAPAAGPNHRGSNSERAAITIDGRAPVAKGQSQARQLQLRNLETGQLVGTTTADSSGAFSFAGRRPGSYSVELVSPAGAIVATSAAVALPAGASATVTVAAASRATGTSGAGASAASIVTTAVAAGIPGVAAAGRHHPSPSF